MDAARQIQGVVTDAIEIKRALKDRGVLVTRSSIPLTLEEARKASLQLGFPVLLKTRDCSISHGCMKCFSMCEIDECWRPGLMIEEVLAGVSLSIISFVQRGQVVHWCLAEEYISGVATILSTPLADETRETLGKFNHAVIAGVGFESGFCRIDFLLLDDARPLFEHFSSDTPTEAILDLISQSFDFDALDALTAIEKGLPFFWPKQLKTYTALLQGKDRANKSHILVTADSYQTMIETLESARATGSSNVI